MRSDEAENAPSDLRCALLPSVFLFSLRDRVIARDLLALQVDIEPIDNMLQSLHPVPGLARAGEFMGFSRESVRMSDGPIGEHASAAATSDSKVLFVDIPPLDQLIHADHQIFVIVAGIAVLNDVGKVLSIARAAAWVRIQHYITFGCHPL